MFGDRTSFRAKGLSRHTQNRNSTAVFGDGTSFRAKGLSRHTQNRNSTAVVWRSNLISCESVACKIAILSQFLAIEPRYVQKGCVSCRLVGTAPRLKREIEKEEKEEGKRARGQERM